MVCAFYLGLEGIPTKGLPRPKFNKDVMNKVFYPELSDQEDEVYTEREREIEKEENFMNLWGYLRRRYPNETLEEKKFSDLINLKIHLEGPRRLREWTEAIASVRKHCIQFINRNYSVLWLDHSGTVFKGFSSFLDPNKRIWFQSSRHYEPDWFQRRFF